MNLRTQSLLAAFGCVLCGAFSACAQPLQPCLIFVQLSEIDREFDHVFVFPQETSNDASVKQAAYLGLSFQRKSATQAEEIVQTGRFTGVTVHVMDGTNVIVACKISAVTRLQKRGAETSYGLLLAFDSLQEAEAIANLIREDWDNYFRRRLDDKHTWMDGR